MIRNLAHQLRVRAAGKQFELAPHHDVELSRGWK
jgi:hypothetical protein